MVDVIESLRRHFGHLSFPPGQGDVVRAGLEGHDVLAVMPIGSGKSLGFQLPAVLLRGTTIVSPLIARCPGVPALRRPARTDRAHRQPVGDSAHPEPSRPAHRGSRTPRVPAAAADRRPDTWDDDVAVA